MISERNKEIRDKYKTAIRICDIAIVLVFLMNLSCLAMTNMMVAKETIDAGEPLVFREVNPVMAKVGEFEEHSESKVLFPKFILYALAWAVVFFGYIFLRYNIKTKKDFWMFIAMVVILFSFVSNNFINDFSFFISKVMMSG